MVLGCERYFQHLQVLVEIVKEVCKREFGLGVAKIEALPRWEL